MMSRISYFGDQVLGVSEVDSAILAHIYKLTFLLLFVGACLVRGWLALTFIHIRVRRIFLV